MAVPFSSLNITPRINWQQA